MPYIPMIAVLVVFSAIFSGTETSFTSISIIQKKELERSRKKSAKVALELVNNPSTLLTTTLIGNNIVNIGASSLATQYALEVSGSTGVGIATGLLTLIILIFGEITPKQLAMSYNLRIVLIMARPVKVLTIILFPLVVFFRTISNTVTKVFCRGGKKGMDMRGLMHVIEAANEDGVVDDHETDMVGRVFSFSDTRVKNIMTPRYEVFSLPAGMTVGESWSAVIESGFSRIPVYDGKTGRDSISGVLILRDLLSAVNEGKTDMKIGEIAKEACFVPELLNVRKLFALMKEKRTQLAVALDEYGELSGVCTVEDVVEELFGEIWDEHEKPEPDDIVPFEGEEGKYRVQSDASFKAFSDRFGFDADDASMSGTVASFVMQHSDNILSEGDTLLTDAGVFTVLRMDGMRAEEFSFVPKAHGEEEWQ